MNALVFLLASIGMQAQDESISVGNLYLGEMQLLERYADMKGPKGRIWFVMSTFVSPMFNCTKSEKKALLDSFKLEYGVDFQRKTKDGRLDMPFPKFKVVTDGKTTLGEFIAQCSSDSLTRRALSDAVHNRLVTSKASMVSLSYVVRPWISDKLKRTELLSGTLVVRSPKGQVRDVYLMYSP
jgi:hypothetical protein